MLINRLAFVKIRLKYLLKILINKTETYTLKSLFGFKIKIKKKNNIDMAKKY